MIPALIILGPLLCWLAWGFSLRRTPYALTWGIATVALTLLCVIATLGVLVDPHATLIGELGVIFGMAVPSGVAAMFTEAAVSDRPNGQIARWRRAHNRPSPTKQPWQVLTQQTGYPNNDTVKVYIQKGQTSRYIGGADPVNNMDGFLEITTKAQQAAEQYNALKIGAE